MNRIMLMGRLTCDPEVFVSKGEKPTTVARYTLAVDKKTKREEGIKADYFDMVSFDRKAEFTEKYLKEGTKILIYGHVQTGTYFNQDNVKMPFFEVVVDEQEFAESKKASQTSIVQGSNKQIDEEDMNVFAQLPEEDYENLPFD